MRDILKSLLSTESTRSVTCRILSVVSPGRYLVAGGNSLRIEVNGKAGYLPGSLVDVADGQIIGIGSQSKRKTIRV